MKEIQIEEMKNIQLDILKFVDSLCHKHKINYSIFYGTLIGAIRHEGYIPWDDDIDIVLLRDDYNRLLEAFNNEHHQYYTFNTHQSSKHYFFPYGKVSDSRTVLTESGVNGTIGVNIDVFPIDFISDDVLTAESIIKQSAKIRKLLIVKRLEWRVGRRFWKNIMVLLFKFILSTVPIKVLTHKIHNIATHASVGFSNTVANIVWGAYLKKELLPYSMFCSYTKVDFEGEKFMSIEKYDECLKTLYGNYLQLPPEEKRVSHHGFKAYWKEH